MDALERQDFRELANCLTTVAVGPTIEIGLGAVLEVVRRGSLGYLQEFFRICLTDGLGSFIL